MGVLLKTKKYENGIASKFTSMPKGKIYVIDMQIYPSYFLYMLMFALKTISGMQKERTT